MARSGQAGPSQRRLLVVAGAVAMLAPVLVALVVGWAASLVAGLLVGLAVSLLLTLMLLAAGWRLLGGVAPPAPSAPPASPGLLPSPGVSAAPPPKPETRSPEPSSVLLVEDDPVSRRIVGRLLQRLGVQADAVADGQAAVEAVRECRYALVLMDCQLPVLDGFVATARIREWEAARSGDGTPGGRLPIVALTAANPDDVQGRGRAAGMDDFLSKPLDLNRLAAMLARWQVPHEWTGQSTSPAAAVTDTASTLATAPAPSASTATTAPPADVPPVLDPAGLPLVDGQLPAPYQEIVQLFRQEAARRMEALAEAAARADYPQVARIAHTLAGSASSIGAARLGAASAALEALAKGTEHPGEHLGTTLDETAIASAVEAVRRALHELDAALVQLVDGR